MTGVVSHNLSVHQEHEFLIKLETAGLTGPLAQRVIESPGNALAKEVIVLIRGELGSSYVVDVNYDQTVERLVKAGKYDWVNSHVTDDNFPPEESGEVQLEIILLNFDLPASSGEVIKRMSEQGLCPVTLKELLALGAGYPDLQRGGPIVAFGSTWRHPHGSLRVPYLGGHGSHRLLDLPWFDSDWSPSWRFAAVRK